MTTDFYTKDLELLADKYCQGKERFKIAVAEDDYIESARFLSDSIKWKKHQQFANAFKIEDFDRILDRLEDKVIESSTVANSCVENAVVDIAIQDAEKEQYAFCLRVKRSLAKRNIK